MKLIAAALIKAKSNFLPIYKTSLNPHFKSKYASLDLILEAIDKPLGDAGIVLIQPTIIRDGVTVLSTQLIHADSGESIESELIIPTQSDPQKLGSAMTYYRRFSICSILAIAAEPDDDGTTATSNTNAASASNGNAAKPSDKPAATKQPAYTPPAKPVVVNSDIEASRQATRECFEILEWKTDRIMEWSAKINPAPFDSWTLENWRTANTKALMEIDSLNS